MFTSSFISIGSVICSVTALWCHQYPHPYRAPSCRKAYSRHTKFQLDSFRWSNAKLFTALTETDRQWLFFIYRILQPFFEWCAVFTLPSHFPVFLLVLHVLRILFRCCTSECEFFLFISCVIWPGLRIIISQFKFLMVLTIIESIEENLSDLFCLHSSGKLTL